MTLNPVTLDLRGLRAPLTLTSTPQIPFLATPPVSLSITVSADKAEALDLGGEALVLAAARGDVMMLRSLVQSGVPIDAYGSVDDPGNIHNICVIYIYICMYVYIYMTYIHTHIYMYVYIDICIYSNIYIYVYMHICIYI